MVIGIANVEKVVFEDSSAWRRMGDLTRLRDQWAISRLSPALRPTGRRALVEFLEAAGEIHEAALSDHFGEPVTIDKASLRPVVNIEFDCGELPDMSNISDYAGFSASRDGDTVRMTIWR